KAVEKHDRQENRSARTSKPMREIAEEVCTFRPLAAIVRKRDREDQNENGDRGRSADRAPPPRPPAERRESASPDHQRDAIRRYADRVHRTQERRGRRT